MNESIDILIIEDDEAINRLLCSIVKRSGYHPKPAYSGTEAMIYLEQRRWDMVLIDLMLPGMSGERILEEVTAAGDCPVIIISAKLETQSKINALRGGADDYITKPFDVEEVSARIDSCLRRYGGRTVEKQPAEINYKDIRIVPEAKQVTVNNKTVKLTAREYDILYLLVSSPGKVYAKADLFERVWNEPYYGDDNTINVHLSHVRNKLYEANPDETYIETIWGMGYKMNS
ncbi:response regulator transcription factor [Jeotgalibacillus salarius]|uniref:Response regulator transcription factor n=1 Tax=Jeotgalibacillus salarius TaxID=546023 RepID=A0A4Y8LER4_9BACL|nr:response regulator transcription factor [Jeotgalibacillus salarius]TFE00689.1 response regulator transcription factor [Jeotgalibacillus salarius]